LRPGDCSRWGHLSSANPPAWVAIPMVQRWVPPRSQAAAPGITLPVAAHYCSSGPGQRRITGWRRLREPQGDHRLALFSGTKPTNAIRKRHAASSRCEFGPSTEEKRAHDQGHSGHPMGPRKAVLFGNLAGRARAWPLTRSPSASPGSDVTAAQAERARPSEGPDNQQDKHNRPLFVLAVKVPSISGCHNRTADQR